MAMNEAHMQKRECGIDLLKVLAMFLVVLMHVFLTGMHDMAEAWNAKTAMPNSLTTYTLYVIPWGLAACCVDCFALATGYISITKKYRWQRLLVLWLQTVVLGLICLVVFKVLSQHTGICVTSRYIGKAFMPITNSTYWYFTAYAGLFVLIPFINSALKSLSAKQLHFSVLSMLIVFSLVPTIIRKDLFYITRGFSVWWLALCYIFGAYMRMTNLADKIAQKIAWCTVLISWLLSVALSLACFKHKDLFLTYISFGVIVGAIAIMILCLKTKFDNRFLVYLARLSPYTFGVYIIHEYPFVKEYFNNRLQWISTLNPAFAVIVSITIAAIVFFICVGIDYCRAKLFELAKVRSILDRVAEKINFILQIDAR